MGTGAYSDNGFYNGWSGGRLEATPAISGNLLTSRTAADKYCKKYFGPKSRIA